MQARRNATRAATYRHHKLKADHAEIISIHTDKKRKIEDSPEAVRDMTVNFRDMLSVDSPDSLHTDSVHTGFISPEAIKWVKQQPNIGTGKPECLELPCTLSEHDTEYVSVHEHHQEYDLPFPAHRHEEYDLPSPAHHHEEYDLPSPIQSPPGSPPASTQVYPDHNLILKHDIGQPETDDETNPKQTLSVSVSDNSDNTIMACPCCDAVMTPEHECVIGRESSLDTSIIDISPCETPSPVYDPNISTPENTVPIAPLNEPPDDDPYGRRAFAAHLQQPETRKQLDEICKTQ